MMITNYFRIALRSLRKNKMFSTINIIGLSVGMMCCILLLLYIRSEFSYDKYHEHVGNLYLVRSENSLPNGDKFDNPRAPSLYTQAFKAEFPEIKQVTRIWPNFLENRTLFKVGEGNNEKLLYETNGYHVDSTFFEMFSYQFLEGNAQTALIDPRSVVLSEQVAEKLFGNEPALNQTVRIGGIDGNGESFHVTGVYRDESRRSHIDARYFLPMTSGWVGDYLKNYSQDFSGNNMFYTYILLNTKANPDELNKKLPAFIQKYAGKDLKKAGFNKKMFLLPVRDIHFFSKIDRIITPTTTTTYLYVLASIALFILLIACVNFMNLSTAGSAKRGMEVGIRKILGAGKNGLIGQFLGESVLLTLLSLVIAGLLVMLLLPFFNQLSGKSFLISDLFDLRIILAFLAMTLITGLLAGSYPAFYLSVIKPADTIKGKFINSLSATGLRKGLVIFQFVVAIGLVVATMAIWHQMRFMRNQPLGFAKDQQIVIPLRSKQAQKEYATFRSEILQNNHITGASGTSYYPGIVNASDIAVYLPGESKNNIVTVKTNWVAPDFMKTMEFQMVAGRMFSEEFPGDINSRIVVNEATLRMFSIPVDKAIGQKLNFNTDENSIGSLEIMGVVRDFHFSDLRQTIEPYAFFLNDSTDFNYIIAHSNTAEINEVLPFLERKWKSLVPDEPFTYTFLDEDFESNYVADNRTYHIVISFTIISILISCLGLFGLVTFATRQRTKEIGVRKVNGARVLEVVTMLNKDFVKWIVIAFVIATPIAWYMMNKWLENFAYRTTLSWWIFALAGVLALGIALLTVSWQSWRAATRNPVEALRYE
ncbi:ABC transporter permease [Maribellus maritimus]|uniref:ABC transporter permease n=1 Tax=Maribellus maritimus TaxID=2870838 RepID=UPI001EE9D9D5|nr:ABC transporter permease [Maribellus maritimus]MCG6189911.1 ABC transporter permease [Maribellus maritimus]